MKLLYCECIMILLLLLVEVMVQCLFYFIYMLLLTQLIMIIFLNSRKSTALDIVLDTDRLDYSVLGNVDPDLNILLDNNSINCGYFTEMEVNNNSFIDTNFSIFNLNIRKLYQPETCLSEYNKSLYNKGYSHIYKIREKTRGGGVSMFINNKLNFQVRDDITFNLKNIDLIAIKILKDELNTKRNVFILTIYRLPDVLPNLFNDKLNDLLQMLNQDTSNAIINPNINVNNFQNIFLSYLYKPLIDKHTRIDKKIDTSTLLDNIYSNVTQITNTIHSGVFKTDYSDHYSIFCVTDLVIRTRNTTFINKRDFSPKSPKF